MAPGFWVEGRGALGRFMEVGVSPWVWSKALLGVASEMQGAVRGGQCLGIAGSGWGMLKVADPKERQILGRLQDCEGRLTEAGRTRRRMETWIGGKCGEA